MKINISSIHFSTKKSELRELFKIMKISIILFFVFSFQLMAVDSNAQDAIIELYRNNLTIGEFINEVEKQTDYLVVYSSREVNTNKKIDFKSKSDKVSVLLDEAFANSDIGYEFENNYIVLVKRAKHNAETITNHIQSSQKQSVTVSGSVVDSEGVPVIGATIIDVSNPSHGTVSDYDGNFILTGLTNNSTLQVSYVGMITQEIALNNRTSINVILQSDSELLDELVVVGYGVQRKANLTGAISVIDMEEVLGDRPVSNVYTAIQGSIPGLTISGNSSPGQSGKSINLRGTLSINGGEPLVLIDNAPGDLDMINPEDIESISVLKDASSSAIYGARAAGGVILVTTKRPSRVDGIKFTYNNNFGFSNSINRPEQAALTDYFRAYQDAGFSNTYWGTSQDVEKWIVYLDEYKRNPDAFNIIGDGIYVDEESGIPYFLNESDKSENMLTTGFTTSHNLSASGGTDVVRYRLSGGYNYEDGPLITSKDHYKRINIGSFVSADMTNWLTQELDFKFAHSKESMPGAIGGVGLYPLLVNFYPEGMMPGSLTLTGEEVPTYVPSNVITYGEPSTTTRINPRIFTKSILKPVKDLQVILEYTYNRDDYNLYNYTPKWKYTTIQMAVTETPANDILIRRRYYYDYNSLNAYANYNKSILDHNFQIMGGVAQESSFYENIRNEVYDQISPQTPALGNATGEIYSTENYSEYSIRSAFYRFNYNYKNKYLLELNGRYDGSSKFPKANRFGFFPSFSAGWQIAQEDFMQSTTSWIDELKLRFSWGEIGNQNISPYLYNPDMSIDTNSDVWLNEDGLVTTIAMPALVRHNFTWETVETKNIGVDFSFFNNKLRGTYEWYQRDTKDMITTAGVLPLPSVVGSNAPAQNAANMQTKGWELSLNWSHKINKLGYRIGFNLYDRKSYITKYSNESGLLSDYYVGQQLGEIWGYVSDGYYTKDDFQDLNSWQLNEGVTSIQGYNVRPGDMKFLNLMDDENSTNEITVGDNTVSNPGDRRIIGNNTLRYQFGLNLGLNYEGFDLSILAHGVGKRDVWMSGSMIFPFAGLQANSAVFNYLYYNQTDYWQPISLDPSDPQYMVPKNPNPKYYRLYDQVQNVVSNTRVSDKYLQNAAYLRIKNVTLSYVFPKKIVRSLQINNLKLFISIENLATFTDLPKGSDPERTSWNYPFYRTTSFGTNITF